MMATLLPWLDALPLLLALAGVGLYLYGRAGVRARLAERARTEVQRQGMQQQGRRGQERQSPSERIARLLRWLGRQAPMLSAAQRSETLTKLVAAGFRSPQALVTIMALSLISVLVLALLPVLFVWPILDDQIAFRALSCLLGVYLGSLLPRVILDRLVAQRQQAIQQSLPDALDLLVICTNAGLGLNSALQRVADELEIVYPALSDELKLTASELKISSDMEAVLKGLAQRTQLEAVRTLVTTLLQSRQYGTAITQALRILARTERTARMMRLEEAAAKLSVKITLPMMLFILPTVLIVAAGPAVLGLMQFFEMQ
ncbi:MAG: type II secretion system F family protein [Corticimicrobacter sp.]|uniref:type II secretion system F family protein n=1 Tax=Corticimicrobacter sp. TaxID=2678536 RepID=UPI0032DBCFC5